MVSEDRDMRRGLDWFWPLASTVERVRVAIPPINT
jgi:hypothetical protein